ncbi:MAG TPA: exosortase E/protease, VPEID-CTERM system [Pirellulales bacterium]|nr:exosortase E/protease, VPEID-CTERM system [Pirellulales bacterium]
MLRRRCIVLTALLIVEAVGLAVVLFDVGNAAERFDWLSILLGAKPRALAFSVVVIATVALLAAARLRGQAASNEWHGHRYRVLPFLIAHGAALIGFVEATTWILRGEASAENPWVIAAWCTCGLATLIFWALCLLPVPIWRDLLPGSWGIIGGAVCIGALAWIFSAWSTHLWNPLGRPTVWLVAHLLDIFFREVVYDPAHYLVGTPQFTVEIAPACSGYEGLGLMSLFLGVALWALRDRLRFPRALLLFPLGLGAMWFANGVRLAALVWIGARWSPGIASRGFHSQAGWLAFIIVALLLIHLAVRSRWLVLEDCATPRQRDNPGGAYLMPLLVMLATSMVALAFSEGNADSSYPWRALVVGLTLLYYRREYREWRVSFSPHSIALGTAVFLIWLGVPRLIMLAHGHESQPVMPEPSAMNAGVVAVYLRILGYIVLVPIIEELAFRGYLLRRLIARDFETVSLQRFTWLSFLGSSLLFGSLHGSHWIVGTLAGMAYALAAAVRGQLGDAIIAHGTTNVLLAISAGICGDWSLMS